MIRKRIAPPRCGCTAYARLRLEARDAAGALVEAIEVCGDEDCTSVNRAITRLKPLAVGAIVRVQMAERRPTRVGIGPTERPI